MSPPPRSLGWQAVLACDDDDDDDDNDDGDGDDDDDDGDDDDDDDDDDSGGDVLACAPSSTGRSTAHECQDSQSPASPDLKIQFEFHN